MSGARDTAYSRLLRSSAGVTLFELLVAMVLLAMVTTMLYSVLNAGINFSDKGERRLGVLETERSLLELLHGQVHGALYDIRAKRVMISTEKEDMLRIVTTAPLIERKAGVVLAIYRYDDRDRRLYYTEKADFYREEYDEDFEPRFDDMIVLMEKAGEMEMEFDDREGVLALSILGREYELVPRCWLPEDER